MKIEFHDKDKIATDDERDLMLRKVSRLKKYVKDEPIIFDIYVQDETGIRKGGTDKVVEISSVFQDEKIFTKAKDSRLLRSFATAYLSSERQLRDMHRERIDKKKIDKLDTILRALRIRK